MGVRSKYTEDEMAKAVKMYAAGTPVRQLAKTYKISIPGLYRWIAKAQDESAMHAQSEGKSAAHLKLDRATSAEAQLRTLKQENEMLKRKLFELMVETKRI